MRRFVPPRSMPMVSRPFLSLGAGGAKSWLIKPYRLYCGFCLPNVNKPKGCRLLRLLVRSVLPSIPVGRLAQLVRAPALQAGCRGFESLAAHQLISLCQASSFDPYPERSRAVLPSVSVWAKNQLTKGVLFMSEISTPASPVVVVGFDMPFWPLVRFLIKIAIASIPAGIVIAFLYMVLGWIYGAILVATHHTNLLR